MEQIILIFPLKIIMLLNLSKLIILTANKCPKATASPIVSGAEPCKSVLFSSREAKTVNTLRPLKSIVFVHCTH